jgi:hypothetical protein
MRTSLIAAGGACALLALISGCGQDGPFALSVNQVNESPPQRNAVIALSDPQIYTRERLLNDRQLEIQYLMEQLKQIDKQDFTPRLKRDIDMLVEMAAALSVKFNPIAGAEVSQAAELTSLKNEVQIEQMRNLLDQVRKENDRAEESAAGTAGTTGTTAATGLEPEKIDVVVAQAQKLLDELEKEIEARVGEGRPELRGSSVNNATPSEILRDKLAYRNEIQAAIEQAQLDDRHDLNGNALYRLQFKATVFPGQVKDKYGVARLTILPPLFADNAEVSKLYTDWLSYVAAQLNPSLKGLIAAEASEQVDPATSAYVSEDYTVGKYLELGPATGLYRILSVPFSPEADVFKGEDFKKYKQAADLALEKDKNSAAPRAKSEVLATVPGEPETKALYALQGNLPDVKNPPSKGQFQVPVPPLVLPAGVLIAINSESTEQYLTLFAAAEKTIEVNYMNPEKETLKWTGDDNGQCFRLEASSPKTDDKGQITSYAGVNPTPPIDLRPQAGVSDQQSFTTLRTALTESAAAPPAINSEAFVRAIQAARNIRNLAPAYALAIERTIENLQRSPNDSSPKDREAAIGSLRNMSRNINAVAVGANSLLTTLHRALLVPVTAMLDDRAYTQSNATLYKDLMAAETADEVQKLLDESAKNPGDPQKRRGLLAEVQAKVPCLSFNDVAGRIYVPSAFYETVTAARDAHYDSGEKRPFAGATYAYSTAPAELAQRVSTVASATQALDLMMAVSAIIPSAGVGLSGAGQLRQIASGHVDAIESAPLIVGFSNNGAAGVEEQLYGAQMTEPNFGWVFGPKVTVDAANSELALSQVLVQQPVTADISVPGWWRSLRLRVETVWAANFEDSLIAGAAFDGQSNAAAQPNERATDYIMDVPLQTNPATYEQLTEYIANKTWGLQYKEPVILSVTPETLPACDKVTLLIAGTDLWRGVQAYIGGIAASEIKIMPDMQGLAATFDLSKADLGVKDLVIWTQLGRVQPDRHVSIVAGDKCAAVTNKDIVNAKIQGPATFIPIASETLVFEVKEDFPKSNYRLVLSRPGQTLAINEVVRTGKTTFTVTWPVATAATPFGANKPANGDAFKAQLFRVNENTTTDLLATLPPVIYFEKAIESVIGEQLPKPAAKAVTADKLTYAASFTVPAGFAAAYGEISSISLDLKDGTTKVKLTPDGKIMVDGNAVSTGFTLDAPLTSGTVYKLTLVLTTGAKVISLAAFDVKG